MKTLFGICIGLLMISGVALAAGNEFYNPDSNIISAVELFKEFKQNRFAFKKNFSQKKMIVVGIVEKVGEGFIGDMDSQRLPVVNLQGLFDAFVSQSNGLDLAEINQGDIFNAICTDVKEEFLGIYTQGICQPVLLARPVNQKRDIIWVTPDREAMKFAFSPQTIERLTAPKQ